MISGQKSLRFFALLTWIVCMFYTASLMNSAGYLFALAAASVLTVVVIAVSELKKMPVHWRACVCMILILVYTFLMAYQEGMIISAPLSSRWSLSPRAPS